jgi:hypothetical protein
MTTYSRRVTTFANMLVQLPSRSQLGNSVDSKEQSIGEFPGRDKRSFFTDHSSVTYLMRTVGDMLQRLNNNKRAIEKVATKQKLRHTRFFHFKRFYDRKMRNLQQVGF